MKMKSIVMLFGAALFGFGAVSCDSPQEEAREEALEDRADAKEEVADAVRESGERKADAQEEAADAVREDAERRADALEDAADRTRDQQ